MELQAAKRAGELAANVEARQAKLAEVQRCIDEGWSIVDVQARNPQGNYTSRLVLSALDPETNAMCLAFIKQIYEGQLQALQADLATAETWTP